MSSKEINITPFSAANSVKPPVTSVSGAFAGGLTGPSPEPGIAKVPGEALPGPLPGDSFPIPPAPAIGDIIDHVGPVTGNVAPGSTTDDPSPTISGSGARPGDLITVFDNGMPIGVAIAGRDGNWSVTPAKPLGNGSHSFTATETNPSTGLSSLPSAAVSIIVDTPTTPGTPETPAAPTIDYLVDAVGSVQGNVVSGGTTDDVNGVLKGHSSIGDSVRIYDGATLLGYAKVSDTGEWSFQLHNMSSGTHSFHAVSNIGADSVAFPVTFGADAPVAATPAIDAIIDHVGPVTRNVSPGGATDDPQPTFSGKGNSGDIVTVSDNGTPIGSAAVDANGHWSFTPANPLAEGSHSITLTGTNPSTGVTSPASHAISFSVDTTVPTVPHLIQVDDHVGPIKGAISSGSTTDDSQALFRGDGVAPGDIVNVFNNGTLLGTTVADGSGNWSFAPALPMANGAHDITFKATHLSTGAVSAMSDAFHYTIEATPPNPLYPGHVETFSLVDQGHDAILPDSAAPASAHVADGRADTIAFTGDHQILDLSALTGKTAAAKISGVEVFDLGGHQNTLKVSLLDVLNLGEKDLFVKDGEQQVVVKGGAGDKVDLSNTHVAGVADGQWEQHGNAQVGGVTYAVYRAFGRARRVARSAGRRHDRAPLSCKH